MLREDRSAQIGETEAWRRPSARPASAKSIECVGCRVDYSSPAESELLPVGRRGVGGGGGVIYLPP